MRTTPNSENVASSAHTNLCPFSSLRFSNSEPLDRPAAPARHQSLLTSSRLGRRIGIPARRSRAMPGRHSPAATRHSQTSRNARNSLKTKDGAPFYPRRFPTRKSSRANQHFGVSPAPHTAASAQFTGAARASAVNTLWQTAPGGLAYLPAMPSKPISQACAINCTSNSHPLRVYGLGG
jgi:hypothetical protein